MKRSHRSLVGPADEAFMKAVLETPQLALVAVAAEAHVAAPVVAPVVRRLALERAGEALGDADGGEAMLH